MITCKNEKAFRGQNGRQSQTGSRPVVFLCCCRPSLTDPGGMSITRAFNSAPAQVPGLKTSGSKKRFTK